MLLDYDLADIDSLLLVPNSVRTSTGKYVDFTNLTPDVICLEDIAHSLSMQCRFGGHIPRHYSIAQHSVHCSEIVDEGYELEALMHDASEAYMLDIPKPLKNQLPDYEVLETKMMRMIAKKYGFDYPLNEPVKAVDAIMLKVEFLGVMLGKGEFECWTQEVAKEKFIKRYNELTK